MTKKKDRVSGQVENIVRRICYNCKYRGEMFRINNMGHCHCEHPDDNFSGDKTTGWDTLREFWATCDGFEQRSA